MDDMKLFIPITKIDAAQRLVYGVVTAEAPDVSGEVCDYASTKPLYQKWSQRFADATDGKSFGNLRAMHANVAAGKLVEIAFNDEAKRIEICGKVVEKLDVKCLLILRSSGRVDANVSYGLLQIEQGASIAGGLSSTEYRPEQRAPKVDVYRGQDQRPVRQEVPRRQATLTALEPLPTPVAPPAE